MKYILVDGDNRVSGSISERDDWTDKEVLIQNLAGHRYIRIDNGIEPYEGWVYDPDNGGFTNENTVSLEEFTKIRNQYLVQTDHVMRRHKEEIELIAAGVIVDTTVTEEEYILFLTYRQTLRELPEGYVPTNYPIFPNKPKTRRGVNETPGPRFYH